jgi:hypothetical protein
MYNTALFIMSLIATQNIVSAAQPSKPNQKTTTVIKHELQTLSAQAIEAGKNKQISTQKIASSTLDTVCNCLNTQIAITATAETAHSFTEEAYKLAQKKTEPSFKKTRQELERLKVESKQLKEQLQGLHQKTINALQAIIAEHEKNIIDIQKKQKELNTKLQQATNTYAQAQTDVAKKEIAEKINQAKDEKKALLNAKKKSKATAKVL